MKTYRFLFGVLALAALAVSCDEDEDLALPAMSTDQTTLYFEQSGGAAFAQSLFITSNRDWDASCSADWVVVSPLSGKASENAVEVTVYVDENAGTDRTATIEFKSTTITTEVKVSQTGPAGSVESTYVYSNDFDKEASSQSYGSSGSSWPYLDQFDGWKNAEGSGISTVSYNYNNLSVRNNSNSNGNYSEYDGSGTNNLFFGSVTNYFVIQNITLPTGTTNYSLSFGSEKYLMDGSSVYDHDEFHVYLSDDGSRWVEISYTFPNGDRDALWDYATSTFTLPSGTTSLYIYFTADVASAYRLDDVLLATNFEDGTSINFSNGITDLPGGGEGTGGGDEGGDYVYHNNFDKSAATQTYGSGSSWPYLDQFDGWKNAEGSGISTVSYNYNNVSARNNSNSNGSYSNYSGSGTNNLFFGSTTNYFVIQNITLPSGTTDYALSFGSEKYLSGGSSVFSHTEFHVYLSADGDKWTEISYTFPNGDPDATWDEAATTFTLPSGTTSLYIYYTSDVASAYRIDDVKLSESSTSGTSIDFSNGVELPGGGEGSGGGDEGGDHELVGDGTADNPYTAADALWLANSGNYTSDEVYVKGIISQIDEISTSYGNATYYISDDGKTSEQFEIYRGYSLDGAKFTSSTEIEVGDKVVVLGVITMYYSTPEMTTGSKIVSLEKGDGSSGGGDEGGGDEDEGDLVYGNDFDASVVSSNTTITSSTTAYQNETGSGASNVSYNWSSKMSVRVSNGSAGGYTNASGNNNIFFGTDDPGYFVIKNIALPSGEVNYKLTFGAREDSNVFATGTFKLYVSEDNVSWVQLSYDFPGGNTSSSSWALASTTFTVPSGTSKLYIYYEADVQSVYRIDDMRLTVSDESGTSIDFSTGVSLVGGGEDEGGGGDSGDNPDTEGDGTVNNPYSASEALAIINAGTYTSASVYIKGIISRIDEISTSYGNATYYISDDGTTSNQLEIYRGYSLGGERFTSEDEIKVGDEVIVYGVLTMYGSTPEVTTGSSIYSLNGQTYDAPEHDDGDPFVQNVTWTLGSHASNDKAYLNGSADTYDLLKLGTSSALGDATCTVPAGTKALHFYCIAWNNGGPAPFTVTVGSTAYDSYEATAHSGLANNTPYTITDVTDSDYFEITFDELSADTEVKVESTSSSKPRIGVIGFKYITE